MLGLVPQQAGPTTPIRQRHQAIAPDRFRLFPFRSPLLGESRLFSFPRGTEMFQFPRFPPLVLCVQTRVTPHDGCGVSPFGHPRIEAWSAAPRGFSQPPTSFIGFRRQGIHRWLFVAWKSKMLVLAMKFSRCARASPAPRQQGRLRLGETSQGAPTPQNRAGAPEVAPSKRNRRVRTATQHRSEDESFDGRQHATARVVSDQLGAPCQKAGHCSLERR